MAFTWIAQWLSGKPHSARQRGRRRAFTCRPRFEELEARVVLSDYYLVRGTPAAQTSILFHLNSKATQFNDEIGVYAVQDDQGTVNNLKPTDAGYAAAALAISQPIFTPTTPPGTDNVLKFNGGTLLGFYLVQNGTSAQAKTDNTGNTLSSPGHVTFFSFNGTGPAPNPDSTRHFTSELFGDGSALVETNDQTNGGTQGFNAEQFTVGVAGGSGPSLMGQAGQTVPVTFTLDSRAKNTDELGVFAVDAPNGSIGGVLPGQAGYVQAALNKAQVVFTGSQANGATSTVNLPGGGIFGIYLVQNDTTADALSKNPSDQSSLTPVTFFTFVGANPDQFQHLRWKDTNTFTWDDQTGGGNQMFDALTATFSEGTPTGSVMQPPVTITPTTLPAATANGTYSQTLTASGGTGTKTFAVTTGTLPTGLALSSAGVLSGTPTSAGTSNFTVTATDTQGVKGSQAYTLLVNAFNFQAPTITHAIANQAVAKNASPTTLDLAANFGDPDIVDGNTTVTMNTSSGPINLTLFDQSAPQTVANFVDYINAPAGSNYNSSIFHRIANLASGGIGGPIVQGGGFTLQQNPTNITTLPAGPMIKNEFNPNNPDAPGTIAMAKQGGNPDSATNEFFFNQGDNSQTLGSTNNGGFTVFGKLADNTTSQTALNSLAAIPTHDESTGTKLDPTVAGAMGQLPLQNFSGGDHDPNFPTDTTAANYALVSSVTASQKDALTYKVIGNTDPGLVTTSFVPNHPEQLQLTYAANQTGSAVITVQATNKNGQTVNQTFTVTVT